MGDVRPSSSPPSITPLGTHDRPRTTNGVCTRAGQTQLQRIPWRTKSVATERDIVRTAPLLILYANRSARPIVLAIEPMLMIEPPPDRSIAATPCFRQL